MRTVAKAGTHFFIALLFLVAAARCSGDNRVLRLGDGKVISFGTMIEDAKKAKVIFVGETHDSKKDHQSQLEIVKALHREGVPLVVGLEMFRADSQNDLDHWVKGTLELREFLKVYYDNWGAPWPLYRDIFLYCRDNKIPMLGLNVAESITKKVSRQGFSTLTDEELRKLPPGISCNVDDQYMDFIRKAYAVHGAADKSFLHFCEAQMVWDKAMAWHIVEFLKKNPGRTVIVLAGVGHSWKKAIPEQMGRLSAFPYRVILPEVPERIGRSTMSVREADYFLLR